MLTRLEKPRAMLARPRARKAHYVVVLSPRTPSAYAQIYWTEYSGTRNTERSGTKRTASLLPRVLDFPKCPS